MEIERKFRIHNDLWRRLDKPGGDHILQGYLHADINKSIRIRIRNKQGIMTVKGKTVNISREEYEFPVPYDIAVDMIHKFATGIIEKIRYTIPFKGKAWEVDEFFGANAGLIMAEVELNREDEEIELPEWVSIEVSMDSRYYNANLAKHPYQEWEDH